jgi:hypothetical protein
LSSRLLLNILWRLPDESEFKTWSLRDGDWPPAMEIAAATHEETAKLRASYAQVHGGEGDDTKFTPFESPVSFRERLKELKEEAELYGDDSLEDLYDNLFGD